MVCSKKEQKHGILTVLTIYLLLECLMRRQDKDVSLNLLLLKKGVLFLKNLPKAQLVRAILANCELGNIKSFFSIKPETNIENRLIKFSKNRLIEYIDNAGGQLLNIIRAEAENFPLKAAPTMYIFTIFNQISFTKIDVISRRLCISQREEALLLSQDRAIRAVYLRRELRQVRNAPRVYEIILGYERRIEITEVDPQSQEYGAVKHVYSLENALVWLPENNTQFGVIACGDFSAVLPILSYLDAKFQLKTSLPDLTEEMLIRISRGGNVRNATFGTVFSGKEDDIDVKTITIYDQDLKNRRLFQKMSKSQGREQRAGFYSQHPDILRAGIGITRRYGRIWTPAHLNREELLRLALGIIVNLNTELERVSKENLVAYTGFYSNSKVSIGNTTLSGISRNTFDILIRHIISAARTEQHRLNIPSQDIISLLEFKNKLKLEFVLTYECQQCGTKSVKCAQCNVDAEIKYEGNQFIVYCPSCNGTIDLSSYECDCRTQAPILDPVSHLFGYPSLELLNTIEEYFSHLHPAIQNPGYFVFVGAVMYLISGQSNRQVRRVQLTECELWRTRARIHLHNPRSISRLIRILGKAKEKCSINNWHPRRQDCVQCLKSSLTVEQLENGQVCLLRAFGIPIFHEFDGIHHGFEGADITYRDRIEGREILIGIHFKSKASSNHSRGLGRRNTKIKELFTQVFYSLYRMAINQEHYDVVGISIPNRISDDVITSLECLLLKYGVSFIVIDLDCWIKIISLARENLQFNAT